MTPEAYVPLLSALAGAFIGTIGTVTAVIVQARKEDRRNRREMAVKLATDQQSKHIDLVQRTGGGTIQPVDLYLVHSYKILDALESGKLNVAKLKSISEELTALAQTIDENSASRSANTSASTE